MGGVAMTVEVCTVWAPRPAHEKWDPIYPSLIDLQRRSAHRWGARHMTVTDDADYRGDATLLTELPYSVMPAMIAGVISRLQRGADCDIVFVDCDVLVGRELEPAFDGTFDLGLTRRAHPDKIYINNGAMYVAKGAADKALRFFRYALQLCGHHWGADQEAISMAAAPVPAVEGVEMRGDMRLGFLSMKTHNVIPKTEGKPHLEHPYVVHFKGPTKAWAQTYADKFIFA